MEKILFVCHGNICRSPMAEYICKKMASDAGVRMQIDSAATSAEEVGNDMYPAAKECLKRHGIPFGRHCARRLTAADFAIYDRIFIMDSNNLNWIRRLFGAAADTAGSDGRPKVQMLMSLCGGTHIVADPWYTGDFEQTYSDITAALQEFFKLISRRGRTPSWPSPASS